MPKNILKSYFVKVNEMKSIRKSFLLFGKFISRNKKDFSAVFILATVFFAGILWNIQLPGLYMDEVNPDYFVANDLSGKNNPVWKPPPYDGLLTLGQLYHGVAHYYFGLPFFKIFGTSIESLRVFHALFGAGIVFCVYLLLILFTKNRLISFLTSLILVSDPAFIFAFRTQSYITMSGILWIFFGLIALYFYWQNSFKKNSLLFFSGVMFGWAFYVYFIYIFFLPALVGLIVFMAIKEKTSFFKRVFILFSGFVVGASLYIYGYINLFIGWGGHHGFLDNFSKALNGLNIATKENSIIERVEHIGVFVMQAFSNNFHYAMYFYDQPSSALNYYKVVFLFVFLIVVGLWVVFKKSGSRFVFLATLMFFSSYLICALFFGSRLGAHHMVVLIPIAYVLLGLALYFLYGFLKIKRKEKFLFLFAFTCIFLYINVFSQSIVQKRIMETGGIKRYTNAINELAYAAKSEGEVYVFTEWGFFMPFTFLTGGKVPYLVEMDDKKINKAMCAKNSVNFVFWYVDENHLESKKSELGRFGSLKEIIFYQKNDVPVFFVLQTEIGGMKNCSN